jgi:hypothetical protein
MVVQVVASTLEIALGVKPLSVVVLICLKTYVAVGKLMIVMVATMTSTMEMMTTTKSQIVARLVMLFASSNTSTIVR